ncbi:MAG: cysteine--tRNA ligase [Candidatus Yanofskybacteria bacterium]|nr:cysteine--tRNA ligase [Candidatus Yanofskybacteria bacterium]
MTIYNTLTKKLEPLPQPDEQKKLNMFVCGPTVYDYIHIGNARTFVFFDVVAKYLRYRGYDVNYIQNITDIDNKIIEQAQKEGADPLEYAKKYSDIFKRDMLALGVTSPEYKNATDHIPEVIKQVQTLLDKGNAYVIENDGIYFDLSTFPDYGKLSGRTASMADDAFSRIDDSDKKRNRGDFAIWKFSQEGDPSWSLETGKYLGIIDSAAPAFAKASAGRPGWHIEDTAITEKYFGPQYDIHGGGEDLKFPHHEAEIAQQESASGLKPFVKYWIHSGFLINKNEKMSKSLGNFNTANELLKKYSREVLRFYLLSNYYRSPLQFSEEILKQAQAAIQRITEFKQGLESAIETGKGTNSIEGLEKIKKEFFKKLDDDFNIPEALGQFFHLVRFGNPILKWGLEKKDAESILEFANKINEILGIIPGISEKIPTEILELRDRREKLRKEEKWDDADKIRAQIEKMGYQVEDTIYGSLVSKSNHNVIL